MIGYVDIRCAEWAQEVRGGLPGFSESIFESVLAGVVHGGGGMSDDAWEVEYIIARMSDPWKKIIKTHYLHPGNTDERVTSMRVSRKQYYALLDQAHVVIDRELKLAFKKICNSE